jgi:hypothetical protein
MLGAIRRGSHPGQAATGRQTNVNANATSARFPPVADSGPVFSDAIPR